MNEILNQETVDALRELGEDFCADLVQTFLETSRAEIERLRQAQKSNDPGEVEKAAHSLKGACLGQGAAQMAEVCRELERRGAVGNLAGTGDLIRRLEESLQRTRRALGCLRPPE